jgi:hypothetical protein
MGSKCRRRKILMYTTNNWGISKRYHLVTFQTATLTFQTLPMVFFPQPFFFFFPTFFFSVVPRRPLFLSLSLFFSSSAIHPLNGSLSLHRFLSHSLSPPSPGPSLSLRKSVFSKAMDALSSFFGSQSSSRNRWSYDSLKNLGQISPAIQTHLKQVLIFSKDLACLGFVWLT